MGSYSAERLAAELLMVGFPGPRPPTELDDMVRRGIRTFILFARNVSDSAAVGELTGRLRALAGEDALIGVDQEGGSVVRLNAAATIWPSQMALAATGDVEAARQAAFIGASELSALGINLNLAPVADVLGDPRNPVIGTRAFSDDPRLAAAFTAASVRGHGAAGVAATAKHFPGHGATPVDSHEELPTVERDLDDLRRIDLPPFIAAREAGVDCMMSSHVWYTALDPHPTPATLSPAVVDLARNGIGFEGVLMTDCMEMGAIQRHMGTGEAVVRSIAAGYDLAAVSHRRDRQVEALTALRDAIEGGAVPRRRAEEARERLASLRGRVKGGRRAGPGDGEGLARAIAARAVTLVRDHDGTLPLRLPTEETLGVITFPPIKSSGEEGRQIGDVLAQQVRRRHPRVRSVEIALGPEAAQTGIQAMGGVDTVLVATAFAVGRPPQANVIRALQGAGKRVIAMAVRDPFDLTVMPEVRCFLAVYGEVPVCTEAGIAVIFGEAGAPGRLPVTLEGLLRPGAGSLAARQAAGG